MQDLWEDRPAFEDHPFQPTPSGDAGDADWLSRALREEESRSANFAKMSELGPQWTGEEDDGAIEIPPVEVIGRRFMTDEMIQIIIDEYNDGNITGPGTGTGPGDGGEVDDPECPGQPSVGAMPEADAAALRALANELAERIASMNHQREHSAFIFVLADGTLSSSTIRTGNAGETAPFTTADIPTGATVVGWIHSHPYQQGVDGRFPSNENNAENGIGDWGARDMLVQAGAASDRFNVDMNMLLYILDTLGDKLYEYDKDDRDNSTVGERTSCG